LTGICPFLVSPAFYWGKQDVLAAQGKAMHASYRLTTDKTENLYHRDTEKQVIKQLCIDCNLT